MCVRRSQDILSEGRRSLRWSRRSTQRSFRLHQATPPTRDSLGVELPCGETTSWGWMGAETVTSEGRREDQSESWATTVVGRQSSGARVRSRDLGAEGMETLTLTRSECAKPFPGALSKAARETGHLRDSWKGKESSFAGLASVVDPRRSRSTLSHRSAGRTPIT